MSTDPQTATPTAPANPTFANHLIGRPGVARSAVVALTWTPEDAWQLQAETRENPDKPLPNGENRLRYELVTAELLALREHDAAALLEALGSDAHELMARVNDGWTLRWNGVQFVGHFDADARRAAATLAQRVLRAEFTLPDTWTAQFWLDGADGTDTTADYELALAEDDGIRIWGGLPAMEQALRERTSVEQPAQW